MMFKILCLLLVLLQVPLVQAKSYKDIFYGTHEAGESPRPLVVWLHGCTQSSREFLELTQIQNITESVKPLIYAPEQRFFGGPLKCWNWYLPSTQKRSGFLETMVSQVRTLIANGTVDANRIYVGGFSAGGILAAHLAFCYPDVFSGALIHSAAPYQVLKGLLPGEGREKLGEYAYRCAQRDLEDNKLKTVMVFHGTRDHIAPFVEGNNVFKQAFDFFDFMDDGMKNSSMIVESQRRPDGRDVYLKKDIQIHYYAIEGMGHAWSGGEKTSRYSSPNTQSATRLFFEKTDRFGSSFSK
ncbi:MAG: alpha/beta hydrolase family esterase [Bdellovibrio sp.]